MPANQPVATRPLAIQINGTWYTYGWDLTKNICELYSTAGAITTSYTYAPFGQVTASGAITQPIQWSCEVWDAEVGLVYYNWRCTKNLLFIGVQGFSKSDFLTANSKQTIYGNMVKKKTV